MNKNIEFAIAMNKLGMAHYASGEFEKAIEAYQSAIDARPDYFDVYYNLGLALYKAKHREAALHAYEALIELQPEHLGGRFQLGRLYMERNNYKAALEHFLIAEKNNPEHIETLINLATCYLKLGYLNEAQSFYLKALAIIPQDIQVLFNLGVMSMQQGRINQAIEFYQQALKVDPNFHDAHNNIGVAYLIKKDAAAALLHFRAALRLQPQNQAIRHSIDILTREKKLTTSPPEYIQSLFNSYADHYDAHLTETLNYQVPQQLLKMVEAHLLKANDVIADLEILDIGCGTGLAGKLFKKYARSLSGIDLSANMLQEAKQKKIYDALYESDILDFLKDKKNNYDLIIAADVLVYFGDLVPLFSAVCAALKPNGLFVFNTEINSKEDHQLGDSGRFSHLQSYIDQVAAKNAFQVIQYQQAAMRTQDENKVQGHFYLLKRKP